jgi:hypothetical protein
VDETPCPGSSAERRPARLSPLAWVFVTGRQAVRLGPSGSHRGP